MPIVYSIWYNTISLLLETMNYTPTIPPDGYTIIKFNCMFFHDLGEEDEGAEEGADG